MTQTSELLASHPEQESEHEALSVPIVHNIDALDATSYLSRRKRLYALILIGVAVTGIGLPNLYDIDRGCTGVCAPNPNLSLWLGAGLLIVAAIAVSLKLQILEQRASVLSLAETLGLDMGNIKLITSHNDALTTVTALTQAIQRERREYAQERADLLDCQASYAHDLRNPLTRIGLRCELVGDAELRHAMERDIHEVSQLVDDSLACAKLQRGISLDLRSVEVDDVLNTLVHNYQHVGTTIDCDEHCGAAVLACPRALRRVMTNLIDNALRYGNDVAVRVKMHTESIELLVQDSGPGINPEKLEAVFSPWYRAPETAQCASGSGLGLAICLRLTQAMQGQLHLRNRNCGGLEASLMLPLAPH